MTLMRARSVSYKFDSRFLFPARDRALRSKQSVQCGLVHRRFSSHFTIVNHIALCQHTRHYREATEPGHENSLRLAVKQYIPRNQDLSSLQPDAVTLIGAHANGFPKELYEPLWDDLYECLEAKGRTIRSIWVADIASQGQSGVLNETVLGNDASWWDHTRDLLFLINQKQQEMPQPLIGIGHSVGASHLAALSLIHPSLLQGLVLIDPVIQSENPSMTFAPPSTYRRDLWPSRRDAEVAFRKSKFYQKWDTRVLDKWLEYGLRELPTELYPDANPNAQDDRPVTLTTTKVHEVSQYLRPLYRGDPSKDKDLYADLDPAVLEENKYFYRPEPREIFNRLPELRPPVTYVFGSTSEVATPELRRKKMETTGSGIGGSGGVAAGCVREVVLECGHLVTMEKVKESATIAAESIDGQLTEWTARQVRLKNLSKNRKDWIGIDDDWRRNIGPPPQRRPKPSS